MAGSVAGCRDNHDRAIAEHIQILLHQVHGMILQESRPRVRGRLEYAFLTRSKVVVIFSLLHEDGYAREQFDVSDVVGMRMRNADGANVRRLYANRANRPARFVGGVSLAAVKHVEPVYAFRARLRPASAGQEEHCDGGNNHAHFFHGATSNNHMRAFVAQTSVCALFHPCKKSRPHRLKPVLPGSRRTNLPAICDKATQNFPEFLWEARVTSRALQDIAHYRHCNLPPHVPAAPFPQPRLSFPRGHGWTSRICYPPQACSRALSVRPSPPPDRNFLPRARSERCRACVPGADS